MKQAFIALVLTLCIMACGSDRPPPATPTPVGTPDIIWEWERPAETGIEYPHTLGTHCGIYYTRFDGRDWAAHPPPGLRGPNPPPGWGGNSTRGTMVLVEPDLARFTNYTTGEQVDFTPWAPDQEIPECY
jgi:hypothetical protein